jgi:hypothetical protein
MSKTARRYCACGSSMQVRSDPSIVQAILDWWNQLHDYSTTHYPVTARQARQARRRAARQVNR